VPSKQHRGAVAGRCEGPPSTAHFKHAQPTRPPDYMYEQAKCSARCRVLQASFAQLSCTRVPQAGHALPAHSLLHSCTHSCIPALTPALLHSHPPTPAHSLLHSRTPAHSLLAVVAARVHGGQDAEGGCSHHHLRPLPTTLRQRERAA